VGAEKKTLPTGGLTKALLNGKISVWVVDWRGGAALLRLLKNKKKIPDRRWPATKGSAKPVKKLDAEETNSGRKEEKYKRTRPEKGDMRSKKARQEHKGKDITVRSQ